MTAEPNPQGPVPWAALEDPAVERGWAARGYDGGFRLFYLPEWTALKDALRRGDPRAAEAAVVFLEVDPYVVFSGYEKEQIFVHLARMRLSEAHRERLRAFVLRRCAEKRYRRELRKLTVLARTLATPEFVAELRSLPRSAGPDAIAEEAFLLSVETRLVT
jgi:hypothetical protein